MLEELRAKNYKSLKDLRLEFGKFNVLIGPNASGKSNIMDCLAFLSGLAKGYYLEALLSERGGFDHVAFLCRPSGLPQGYLMTPRFY